MAKTRTKLKHRGIRIHRLSLIMLALAVITSAVLYMSMHMTTVINDETADLTNLLGRYRSDAYELQIASDYLTDKIRCFVVTGKKQYLDEYFEEANVTKRREKAIGELENHRKDSPSVKSIKEAMVDSVDLQNLEYYAARLAVEAYNRNLSEYPDEIKAVELSETDKAKTSSQKKDAAINAVFGSEYYKAKESISSHMNTCLKDLSEELSLEQAVISEKLRNQVFIEHVLTIVLIILMFLLVAITLKMVVLPLRESVKLIRKEKDLPLKGAYEVRFLAKTYNLMHHTNLKSFEKLNFEATHDELTGLYNRRGYDFLLENIDIETCALILIDLDEFKQINDKYGHDIGDKILIKVSGILNNSFRNRDYICRFGGDEMAVIMIHADESMKALIENKVIEMNQILKENEEGLPPISISVGVAFGKEGITIDELFKNADKALYEVKENGRNGVVFN